MRSLTALSALVIATAHLFAQAPQSFDVVSIKPRIAVVPLRVGIPTAAQVLAGAPPDRFDRPDTSLWSLITEAYERFPFEVVGGPDWMRSKSWEVSARASAPVSRTVMRELVRRMLEDRFALKAHVETRGDQPVFRLTLARSDGRLGPKIKQAAMDCRPFLTGARPMAESPKDAAGFPSCSEGVRREPADLTIANGVLTPRLNGQPLAGLVRRLEAMFRRHVIDDTGLRGLYDIEFSYPGNAVQQAPGTNTDDVPSLSTLLQEQLGMRLVGARGPAEVLVIDSAQEPTPN
jgi:uncharacterized protein (TIGR03435 family)